ncbi:MAG: hydrogenase formation protein HypD [Phycisphaerae bacterium]|nr:hydrogenase formation protein HypD [Phycisphaerae bacterium]
MSDTTLQDICRQIAEASNLGRRINLMEVCGTHTVALFRSGVKSLMPANVRLVSGPGCPVCVTSQAYLDVACELAERPEVTVCTYGDMVRVPGRTGSLEQRRATGARVVVVYSARDAVKYAARHPDEQVVFLAVGFETTAPATAAAVLEAEQRKVDNFTVLPGHKLVMPAMRALLSAGDVPIDGFICPGHVSVVIGVNAYRPIVEEFGKPCTVAGFEPRQMLLAILSLVRQAAAGEARLENAYGVAVTDEGNAAARGFIDQVFKPANAVWRAMGTIPDSGLALRWGYEQFDAFARFGVTLGEDYEPEGCRCGEVIQGKVEPLECPLFGESCTPADPVGPCMVSSEGTCAAWYKYNRPRAGAGVAKR